MGDKGRGRGTQRGGREGEKKVERGGEGEEGGKQEEGERSRRKWKESGRKGREGERRREIKMTPSSSWGDLLGMTCYLKLDNQCRMNNGTDGSGGKGTSMNVPVTSNWQVTLYFAASLLLFICILNLFPSDHIFEIIIKIYKLLK